MKTKKLTLSALFIALGIISGHLIYIPVGASKCFPVQHTINVLAAVFLGPAYGVGIAFCISLMRNILSVGTLLAFPGSMLGALLAGIFYNKNKNIHFAIVGEILGTGLLGGLLAFPIAKLLMGRTVGALFFIKPFLLSTAGGSFIAYVMIKLFNLTKIAKLKHQA